MALLVPVWLDPTTLRELRNVSPSPLAPATTSAMETYGTTPAPVPVDEVSLPPGVVIVADTFNRVAEQGWGADELGGSYDSRSYGFADLSVAGGRAVVLAGTEGGGWTTANATHARDVDVLISFMFAARGGHVAGGPVLRATDDSAYVVLVTPMGGSVSFTIELWEHGQRTVLSGPTLVEGLSAGPGRLLRVRARAEESDPTIIRARAWLLGASEPDLWHASVIDWTGRLQAAAKVGLGWSVTGVAQGGADIYFDDFIARSNDPETLP